MSSLGRTMVSLGVWACACCGPETSSDPDWMLGTYSDLGPNELGHSISSVFHYEFREGGVLVIDGQSSCGAGEHPRREYVWTHAGDGAIEAEFSDTRHRFTPGDDCDHILVQEWYPAEERWLDAGWLRRGEVCVRPEECGPDVGECFCESYWCDEAPPKCEDHDEAQQQ